MARKREKNNAKFGTPAPADVSSIYESHRSELKGFISKRVDSKEEAEDILQNVFYSLSRIDLIENPIEHITAWLYSVARNQIIDRSRKHREEPMPVLHGDDDDDFSADLSTIIAATDSDPEKDYLRQVMWDELAVALDELPSEQRTVFELTELQGVSFREISESTGIPVNTLLSRKRYAVLHLRERLAEIYENLVVEPD